MADAPPTPAPVFSMAQRLAAVYGRSVSSGSAPAPAPAPAPAAAAPAAPPPGAPPRYFSQTDKLAARYSRLDAARRLSSTSPTPPAPPPVPAPAPAPAPAAAAAGAPPPAGAAPAPAPAPDASAAPLELDAPAGLDAADPLLVELQTSGARIGLDREKVGAVAALHAKVSAAQDAQLAAMHEGWERAAKSDPEVGGEGVEGEARFQASVRDTKAVLREFGTPGLGKLLAAFHLEQHPELIRLFTRFNRELQRSRRW